jgi:hypothetical protein
MGRKAAPTGPGTLAPGNYAQYFQVTEATTLRGAP